MISDSHLLLKGVALQSRLERAACNCKAGLPVSCVMLQHRLQSVAAGHPTHPYLTAAALVAAVITYALPL
jgi:hypothetical protein